MKAILFSYLGPKVQATNIESQKSFGPGLQCHEETLPGLTVNMYVSTITLDL